MVLNAGSVFAEVELRTGKFFQDLQKVTRGLRDFQGTARSASRAANNAFDFSQASSEIEEISTATGRLATGINRAQRSISSLGTDEFERNLRAGSNALREFSSGTDLNFGGVSEQLRDVTTGLRGFASATSKVEKTLDSLDTGRFESNLRAVVGSLREFGRSADFNFSGPAEQLRDIASGLSKFASASNRAQKSFKGLGTEEFQRDLRAGATALREFAQQAGPSTFNFAGAAEQLREIATASRQFASAINRVEKSISKFGTEKFKQDLEAGARALRQFAINADIVGRTTSSSLSQIPTIIRAVTAELRNANNASGKFGTALGRAGDQASRFGRQTRRSVRDADDGFDRLSRSTLQIQRDFQSLRRTAIGIFAGIGLVNFVRDLGRATVSITQASADFETLTRSINAVSGGAEKGADSLEFLRNLTERLGTSFTAAAQGSREIIAGLRGTVFEGEAARQIISDIQTVSARFGLTEDQTKRVNRAFAQMTNLGRIAAEEVNQLADAGVPAMRALQAATGKSGEEFKKLRDEGRLGLEFLVPFVSQLAESAGGQIVGRLQTFRAELNRLNNGFNLSRRVLGNFVVQNQEVRQILGTVADSFRSFNGILAQNQAEITQFVSEVVGSFGRVATETLGLSNSFGTLTENEQALVDFLKAVGTVARETAGGIAFLTRLVTDLSGAVVNTLSGAASNIGSNLSENIFAGEIVAAERRLESLQNFRKRSESERERLNTLFKFNLPTTNQGLDNAIKNVQQSLDRYQQGLSNFRDEFGKTEKEISETQKKFAGTLSIDDANFEFPDSVSVPINVETTVANEAEARRQLAEDLGRKLKLKQGTDFVSAVRAEVRLDVAEGAVFGDIDSQLKAVQASISTTRTKIGEALKKNIDTPFINQLIGDFRSLEATQRDLETIKLEADVTALFDLADVLGTTEALTTATSQAVSQFASALETEVARGANASSERIAELNAQLREAQLLNFSAQFEGLTESSASIDAFAASIGTATAEFDALESKIAETQQLLNNARETELKLGIDIPDDQVAELQSRLATLQTQAPVVELQVQLEELNQAEAALESLGIQSSSTADRINLISQALADQARVVGADSELQRQNLESLRLQLVQAQEEARKLGGIQLLRPEQFADAANQIRAGLLTPAQQARLELEQGLAQLQQLQAASVLSQGEVDDRTKQLEEQFLRTTVVGEAAFTAISQASSQVADTIGSIVDGTQSATQAVAQLGKALLKAFANALLQAAIRKIGQSIAGGASGGIGSLIGNAIAGSASSAAKGTKTKGPILAMIGDNPSGRELVIPSEKLDKETEELLTRGLSSPGRIKIPPPIALTIPKLAGGGRVAGGRIRHAAAGVRSVPVPSVAFARGGVVSRSGVGRASHASFARPLSFQAGGLTTGRGFSNATSNISGIEGGGQNKPVNVSTIVVANDEMAQKERRRITAEDRDSIIEIVNSEIAGGTSSSIANSLSKFGRK